MGDGYFYASEDGTILRTMVRAEQALTSDAVVFVYSNPKELTVTVSVDQSDITKLTVGDSAYVQSSAGSGYTGVITAIDPVSSSSSRTSVTYSVTVQINVEDEEDSLSANESVTVVFGMTEEEIEQLQQRQSMQGRPDDVSDGDAMPQGGPGGGEKLEMVRCRKEPRVTEKCRKRWHAGRSPGQRRSAGKRWHAERRLRQRGIYGKCK